MDERVDDEARQSGQGRWAEPVIAINGKDVSGLVSEYLKSVTFEDVARDRCDSLDIVMHNIGWRWLGDWYPRLGDTVDCSIRFHNWKRGMQTLTLKCGHFVIDDISFTGSPMTATLSCLSSPADTSFGCKARNKTWENVTVEKIASKITRPYRIALDYDAPKISVMEKEQEEEDDAAFLYSLCKDYNLGMKMYGQKLVIYDPGRMEQKEAVATLTPRSFVGGQWTFTDTLAGTYNGARIPYKAGGSDTKMAYFGSVKESAENARTLRISRTAETRADAKFIALSQVNASNEQATKLSGQVWPDPDIVAGACVVVKDFGSANGKYFVEEANTTLSSSGVSMNLVMHRCVERLRRV